MPFQPAMTPAHGAGAPPAAGRDIDRLSTCVQIEEGAAAAVLGLQLRAGPMRWGLERRHLRLHWCRMGNPDMWLPLGTTRGYTLVATWLAGAAHSTVRCASRCAVYFSGTNVVCGQHAPRLPAHGLGSDPDINQHVAAGRHARGHTLGATL